MKKHFSEEKLIAFIDDELSESEYNLINVHLKSCGKCAGYVDQMQSVFGELSELKDAPEDPVLIYNTVNSWRFLKQAGQVPLNSVAIAELKRIHKYLTVGAVAAGLAIGFLFGDIVRQEYLNEYNEIQNTTVVLQENGQAINDTYVSLIINDGQEDL